MTRLLAGLCPLLMASACDSRATVMPTLPTTAAPSPPARPSIDGPAPIPAATIDLGGSWTCPNGDGDLCVEGAISGADPACFANWDSSGRCKQYNLAAPADGVLVTSMRWTGPPRGMWDPDLFLVAPRGDWTVGSGEWPEKRAWLPVKSGEAYRIVVISYGSESQAFALNLKVERD